MKKLRAAVVGLGVGEQHIQGYRRHPACEVVALCDMSVQKLEQMGEKYPGLRLVDRADLILEDPDIDVVSIASYDNYHFEQIEKGLLHGKHLFVEKPLCLLPWQLERIQALVRDNPGLRLSSNLILRCSPRFERIRQMIAGGHFGRLFYTEGDYEYGRLEKITQGWRGQIDAYSIILGGAVHMVDLLLWLTGDTVTEVSGYGNRIASKDTTFRFNDFALFLLKFKSGLLAKVSANFGCVKPHFHNLKVFGTRATFENGPAHGYLYTDRSPATSPQLIQTPYPGVHKGDLVFNFVQSILEEAPAIVSTQDVFNTMSVCMAAERAVSDSTTVVLGES
ncbi:MAG: gfo/Idh/MocA family oxidoreductase [Desulfobacteraceae bacterium]|nr:MAG: gfo/Idh/MocA family oxidoreductase [Desulfobacteraceae bacterium]